MRQTRKTQPRTNKKTRKQRGGENIEVKHVMLNKAMRAALIKEQSERFSNDESFRKEGFFPLLPKLDKGVGGLTRLDGMKELSTENFDKLLASDPPKLERKAKHKGIELFEVKDGRHRVVRAILNGKNKIPFIKV
jgi:hypothetical protein